MGRIKRILGRAARALVLCIVVLSIFLFLTRNRLVALTISSDPTLVRPRSYCLMNPFRDTAPEKLAAQFLGKLRDGETDVISPYVGTRQEILEAEAKWPIQSWRIGDRTDRADKVELMYWVIRGNGYSRNGYEEEVQFFFIRSAVGWEVESFGAIY